MQFTVIVPRRGINDEGKGKKYALRKLISQATTEYVWLQDDDICAPAACPQTDADLLIMPLRMARGCDNLLCRLQRAEYAALQQLTIETARRGRAVMCSGANLLVRRERWLESYEELHPELPSGDDMFLLESFKRRGLQVSVTDDVRFEAVVEPIAEWGAFFRQRMRWAGKSLRYTDRDIRWCSYLVAAAFILQLICPLVIFVKFPWEYRLIKKRDANVSLVTALLLELGYPVYMIICLVGGWLHPNRW